MSLFSIKMRAAEGARHISGAERIASKEQIGDVIAALANRATHHSLGEPDFINIKLERIAPEEVHYVKALTITTRPAETIEGSFAIMTELLTAEGLTGEEAAGVVEQVREVKAMRGAMLYDVASGKRVEPDHERGIRVTYMDAKETSTASGKNHFREALVLATKVANGPGMIAELCISDDPDYVTGYFASRTAGYVRLTPLKKMGDSHGGRVFICDSRRGSIDGLIKYLEKTPVIVDDVPDRPL